MLNVHKPNVSACIVERIDGSGVCWWWTAGLQDELRDMYGTSSGSSSYPCVGTKMCSFRIPCPLSCATITIAGGRCRFGLIGSGLILMNDEHSPAGHCPQGLTPSNPEPVTQMQFHRNDHLPLFRVIFEPPRRSKVETCCRSVGFHEYFTVFGGPLSGPS